MPKYLEYSFILYTFTFIMKTSNIILAEQEGEELNAPVI